jgi:hypothetical protein
MHAVLLTLIALGGGADAYASGRITQSSSDIYNASASTSADYGAVSGGSVGGSVGGGCQSCGNGHCGKAHGMGGWFGHMPQTCYDPRYGCYFGNGRYMQRYPAFHGTFYRRAYNYRNYFDYPWHAEMHEPTSMFSYNVMGEGNGAEDIGPPPTAPSPAFESARRQQRNTAPIYRRDITDPAVKPAATLRR